METDMDIEEPTPMQLLLEHNRMQGEDLRREETKRLIGEIEDAVILLRASPESSEMRAHLRKSLRVLARLYDIPTTGED